MSKRWTIEDCYFIDLPQFHDRRGNLSFVQNDERIPFEIQRVYFLYDVPRHAVRAAHAHKELRQLFFAMSGSYKMHLDDGRNKRTVTIDNPSKPFFVCPHMWREVGEFTSGAVCVVLASMLYNEDDYLRSYEQFLAFVDQQ